VLVDQAVAKHLIVQGPAVVLVPAQQAKAMLAELVLAVVVEAVAVALVLLELQTRAEQLVVLDCNGQMVPIMLVVALEHSVDLLPAAELVEADLV
jgi:hypothetical protein